MIIAIIGDRECSNYDIIEKAVQQSGFQNISKIVSGGARGIDRCAILYAKEHNIPYKEILAEWNNLKQEHAVIATRINPWTHKKERYNKNAGLFRNQLVINEVDAVIAIQPNGATPGTTQAISLAKKKGIPIHIYTKSDDEYEYKF